MPRLMQLKTAILSVAIIAGAGLHCGRAAAQEIRTLFVAGGCFWCVEADFEKVPGVIEAVSGYAGGTLPNPTYHQVVRGGTGHYEAVAIRYNPDRVSYSRLLHLFFRSIDPTDAGGQFCDRGESYRTAVFVGGDEQEEIALRARAVAEQDLGQEIVTPIIRTRTFYPAEEYHQDYYKKSDIVITRRGPKTKADAYAFYRDACGRDRRVRELWGSDAPFAG